MGVFSLAACTKEKSIEQSDDAVSLENTWRFTQGTRLYSGLVDTVMIEEVNGLQILTLEGSTTDGVGLLGLALGGAILQPGEYISPLSAMIYLEDSEEVFESNPLNADFKINITRLDSALVTGTFSGKVLDSTGVEVDIIAGSFSANR